MPTPLTEYIDYNIFTYIRESAYSHSEWAFSMMAADDEVQRRPRLGLVNTYQK